MTDHKAATAAPSDPAALEKAEAMKPRAKAWFETLRDRICAAFEAIEAEASELEAKKAKLLELAK